MIWVTRARFAWTAVAALVLVACSPGTGGSPAPESVQTSATAVTAPPLTTASSTAITSGTTMASSSPDNSTASPTSMSSAVSTSTALPSLPTSAPGSSSSSRTTTATPAPPTTGTVVVLDPGHNGANAANPGIINRLVDAGFGETKACNTTGTSTNDGYAEHAFTWSVANQAKAILESKGFKVVLTRNSDDGVGPCVNERAAVGNDNNAAAVVSIHGDGAPIGNTGFYAMNSQRLPAGTAMDARSRSLASAVRDHLVAQGLPTSNYFGSNGLGRRDDLAGLNLSLRPTTMIELGNMRDPGDAALMKSADGRLRMAAGIANGIMDFLAR